LDQRWIEHPIATLLLMASIFILRSVPVRLSKYSYLTQTGVAALVGAAAVGPSPVALALWVGVFVSDVLWLRKLTRAGLIRGTKIKQWVFYQRDEKAIAQARKTLGGNW